MMMQPQSLLTAKEASIQLGRVMDYVRKMCREHRIQAFKVANHWRLTQQSIDEWKQLNHERERSPWGKGRF